VCLNSIIKLNVLFEWSKYNLFLLFHLHPRHTLKGGNPIFLISCLFFEVLFGGTGLRYYFFCFFDIQTWKQRPTNVLGYSRIILKNPRTWVLEHVWRLQILFFLKYCACFLRYYSVEPVDDIIFFCFFDVQTKKKTPHECVRRLAHNFKKLPNMGTWTCLKGPNPIFFNFVLVFWGVIRSNRLTILFFFASLTSKHEKQHPKNVLGDSHII